MRAGDRSDPSTGFGETQVGLEAAPLRDAAYVARLLGVPRKSVLQYARDGRLPCVRIGKHVRFVVADVERAVLSRNDAYATAAASAASTRSR